MSNSTSNTVSRPRWGSIMTMLEVLTWTICFIIGSAMVLTADGTDAGQLKYQAFGLLSVPMTMTAIFWVVQTYAARRQAGPVLMDCGPSLYPLWAGGLVFCVSMSVALGLSLAKLGSDASQFGPIAFAVPAIVVGAVLSRERDRVCEGGLLTSASFVPWPELKPADIAPLRERLSAKQREALESILAEKCPDLSQRAQN